MSEFTDKFRKEQGIEFDSIGKYSRILCKNYSEYFDKWWDVDKFDLDKKWVLKRYCSDSFDVI